MIEGLIGKKLGMTEIFNEDGSVEIVTVIEAGPCPVVQKRTEERDGYQALQLGFDEVKPQRVTKPMTGHFASAKTKPVRVLKEFKLRDDGLDEYNLGDEVKLDIFKHGDIVDVTGISKGKGFAGGMKRYGFAGQPDSHGGMAHRRPGSIGQHSWPSRVFKGHKMPGHMGNKQVTVQGLTVIKVDTETNLLLIKGSVPGHTGSYLSIKYTSKGRG